MGSLNLHRWKDEQTIRKGRPSQNEGQGCFAVHRLEPRVLGWLWVAIGGGGWVLPSPLPTAVYVPY